MESLPQIPEFKNNTGNLHPWNNKSCSGEPIRVKKNAIGISYLHLL